MKTKLFIAVLVSGITAAFHRNQSNTVALANAAPPAPPKPEETKQPDLAAENAELRKKVEKLEANQPKNAAAVAVKVAAGLTREQAEAAITHQEKFAEKFKEAKIGASAKE